MDDLASVELKTLMAIGYLRPKDEIPQARELLTRIVAEWWELDVEFVVPRGVFFRQAVADIFAEYLAEVLARALQHL